MLKTQCLCWSSSFSGEFCKQRKIFLIIYQIYKYYKQSEFSYFKTVFNTDVWWNTAVDKINLTVLTFSDIPCVLRALGLRFLPVLLLPLHSGQPGLFLSGGHLNCDPYIVWTQDIHILFILTCSLLLLLFLILLLVRQSKIYVTNAIIKKKRLNAHTQALTKQKSWSQKRFTCICRVKSKIKYNCCYCFRATELRTDSYRFKYLASSACIVALLLKWLNSGSNFC